MIAAEELDMDFGQMKLITHDTEHHAEPGRERRQPGCPDGRQADRAAAAAAATGAAGHGLGEARRPGRRACRVSKGVVSGGGKSVTYGELIGDKLFNVKITGTSVRGHRDLAGTGRSRGSPGTKPVSQYKLVGTLARRGSTSRTRSPARTCTCTTSGCPGCCTAGSCGRAARAPTATAPRRDRLGRRELDRAHPGRPGRRRSATSSASSRRRSTTRSRRPRS